MKSITAIKLITAAEILTLHEKKAAQIIASRLFSTFDLENKLAPYVPYQHCKKCSHSSCLHLEDVTAIPFVSGVPGVEEYQHRARVRVKSGDLFVATTPQQEGYLEYCEDQLSLGDCTFVQATPTANLMNVAFASSQGSALENIVAHAKEHGGLTIHPYMAIEDVWELAAKISSLAEVKVTVIGPPPPTLWIANDKGAFDFCVRELLGDSWVVESHESTDPKKLAEFVGKLAKNNKKVGLKRTRCASAMGNSVFRSIDLDESFERERVVNEFLTKTQWDGKESVLAVAWEETEISPSTQLWIPPNGEGDPYVEGVYEQILRGEEKVFVGSRISTLPEAVNVELIRGSLIVALAFQHFGYVGRCSFDFIVTGDLTKDFRVMFTECNGRWGGTSTPMHLIDRLFGAPRPPYWAQTFKDKALVGLSFSRLLQLVGDQVFDARTGKGRFIFYNVGPILEHGKFTVISLGKSTEEAKKGVTDLLPRLLKA